MKTKSGIFWSVASWLIILLHGLLITWYYFTEYNDFSRYFPAILLTLILVITRAFDFTTKELQKFTFFATLILITITTLLGWGDYKRADATTMLIFTSTVCTGLFFGIAFAVKHLQRLKNKTGLRQFILSIVIKCVVWIPVLMPHKPWDSISDFSFILAVYLVIFFSIFCISGIMGLVSGFTYNDIHNKSAQERL